MRNLTHRWTQSAHYFSKNRALILIFKNRQGRPFLSPCWRFITFLILSKNSTMHPFSYLRPVLPLHRNYSVDLLLINIYYFYHILFFEFIEEILTPFLQVSNLARLISQKQFYYFTKTILLTKLNFILLPTYWKTINST